MRKLGLLFLSAVLTSTAAYAQSEEIENPGVVNAVQDREFRMSHELTLGVGVLPIDAFYKGLYAQVGYTYHFTDGFAWNIVHAMYAYDFDTSLRAQLQRDFGVLPTAFNEVQYGAGTEVMWTPIYGKGSWLNHSVTHFEVFGVLGGDVFNLANGINKASTTFRPAVNFGIGMRIYANKTVSWRLDVNDDLVINPSSSSGLISNVMGIQISAAFNFGGNSE